MPLFPADLPASLCTCTRETANSRPIQQVWRAKGRDQGRAERKHPKILPHDYLQRALCSKNVSPYRQEIQQAIVHDKQDNAKKAQEVMESGVLRSAYYQLKEVERNGKKLNRYIIFKIGKDSMGTLIYIEGLLSEKEMMDMLYKSE